MDRPRRESRQHNGITVRGLSQPTFATKSALSGPSVPGAPSENAERLDFQSSTDGGTHAADDRARQCFRLRSPTAPWYCVRLAGGSRILVLYASANRDERKWDKPEKLDVRRDARDHGGFGFGAHICAGMHLARLEMTALMTAFARRVSRFELGVPVWAINNVLRGFKRLPVTRPMTRRPCANYRCWRKRPFVRTTTLLAG
jgi:hypothetical protein